MEKFFNTSGPIKPEHHYAIPPLQRVDWDEIQHLIASERYFVLHAPRQTGKTSALLAMMAALNVTPDRRLDMSKLLTAFQQFFRKNGDSWVERFDYKEAGPQLLMQAFLQRIIHGGGRIGREYALGRRRTDLLIEWPLDEAEGFHGPVRKIVIELKPRYRGQGLANTLARGLEQTADYADRAGANEAHLVIFDRDPSLAWDDKVWRRSESFGKRVILAWGC